MSAADEVPFPTTQPTVVAPVNPWPGLASYTEQDRELFFGREREMAELLRLIERESLTVLFGRSGLGKTSLLRAAVIPVLREKAYFPLVLRLDYSERSAPPVEQIKELLREAAEANGVDIENVASGDEVTLWEFFHTIECWGPRNDKLTPILIFDQFEEVFTIGRNLASTPGFLEQLADLVENRPPKTLQRRIEQTKEALSIDASSRNYKVVLSLREDYVSKLDSLRPLMPAVMRNRMGLNPLDGERALAVIANPGKRWVPEEVAKDIVAAVAGRIHEGQNVATYEPGAEIEPAYLSVMCHELFRRMVVLDRNEITHDLVEHEQGGILERLYERSFEGLGPELRRFVEDKLVSPAGFRMAVPLAEALSEGVSDQDLNAVVDRRLLRFEDRLGTRYVELSHDLLTRVVQKSRDERRAAKLRKDLLRSRVRAAMAGALALFFFAVLVFVYFAYFHEFTIYSSHWRKRYGMEEPVDTISPEAVKHRTWSLKFLRKGFKPFRGETLSVAAIDSTGSLTERHSVSTYLATSSDDSDTRTLKACQWQLVYDPDGHVIYEIGRDRFDRMVWGLVYSPSVHVAGKSDTKKAMFVGPDGYPQPQRRSAAEYIEIQYDRDGNEVEQHFSDRDGNPAPGPDGAFGRSLQYDSLGRNIAMTSLDEHDQPMNDNAGNATQMIKLDAAGNDAETTNLDRHGHLTLVTDGWAKSINLHDAWGETIESRFFGLHNQPAVSTEVGAEIVRFKYDDRGNTKEVSFYDGHGTPVESSSYNCHAEQLEYDEDNRVISRRFFDTLMHPAVGAAGFHEIRYSYDSRGFVEQTSYFDGQGKPLLTPYHRLVQLKDDFGRVKEQRYFKADSTPAFSSSGQYHMDQYKYDKHGNVIEQEYFGLDGKPVSPPEMLAHKVTFEYDRFGNPTSLECFGIDGSEVNCRNGIHRVTSTYDNFGHLLAKRFFDVKHDPAALDGIHEIDSKYDARGLLLEEGYFGIGGKPVADKDGIHHSISAYNDKRQRIRLEFQGIDGRPAENAQKIHVEVQEFDDVGHQVRITQLRKDDSGILFQIPGVATERNQFDDAGRQVGWSYFDAHDKLVIGPLGFAKSITSYTENGSNENSFFGPDGKLELDPLYGCARWRKVYHDDELISETIYSSDGSLLNGPEGFAVQSVEADADKQGEVEKFLAQDGKPAYGPKGYSQRHTRTTAGKTEITYFDANHQALTNPGEGIPLLYVQSVNSIISVGWKSGLRPGDVIWRFGNWSYPQVLQSAEGSAKEKAELGSVLEASFGFALKQASISPSSMEVIRGGKIIKLSVPKIPDQDLGIEKRRRILPASVYQQQFGKLAAPFGKLR